MRYNDGRKIMYEAVLCLTTGNSTLDRRLESAAVGLAKLSPDDELPVHTRAEFRAVMDALASDTAEGTDRAIINATIRHMGVLEQVEMAHRIFYLYFKVLGAKPL